MSGPYVTTPSENLAVRENQVPYYSPDLCLELGRSHRVYGWAPVPYGGWDDDQKAAYEAAWKEQQK